MYTVCILLYVRVSSVCAVPRLHRRQLRQRPQSQSGDARQGSACRDSRSDDVVHEETRREARDVNDANRLETTAKAEDIDDKVKTTISLNVATSRRKKHGAILDLRKACTRVA